jgi:Flp pilus assembly protein TadG
MMPLFGITFLTLDVAWAISAKATLQWTVREAVRYGVTVTSAQAPNGLTTAVKLRAAQVSMGLLSGKSGSGGTDSRLQVHFFQPGGAAGVTDVTGAAGANNPGNIIQVSVNSYQLSQLLPIFYSLTKPANTTGVTINASSADVIEYMNPTQIPAEGPAP